MVDCSPLARGVTGSLTGLWPPLYLTHSNQSVKLIFCLEIQFLILKPGEIFNVKKWRLLVPF